jgi:hypothetical protein
MVIIFTVMIIIHFVSNAKGQIKVYANYKKICLLKHPTQLNKEQNMY